ncbi:MAG: DNA cytosine methyltransferase, partial [Alphaproteobacteria bacterium]|nr:DNA cytosine methyltransferase [Alphaproteobacteria bacterium]
LHKGIYPQCKVVVGDIMNPKTQDLLADIANKEKPKILLASPCCQQITRANTCKDENSEEQYLFEGVMEHLRRTYSYEFVAIENAAEMLTFKTKNYELSLGDQIEKELKSLGFPYVDKAVQNAAEFGAIMNRPRTIIIASKYKPVKLPTGAENNLCLADISNGLKPLEAGESDNAHWAQVAAPLPECQKEQVMHTPTGEKVKDLKTTKGALSGCKMDGAGHRCKKDEKMHSQLTGSGDITGLFTIAPGTDVFDDDGNYLYTTDARTHTVLEIMRAYRLPDDMRIPYWARPMLKFLRVMLGEAWCPLHCQYVVAQFVKAKFGL